MLVCLCLWGPVISTLCYLLASEDVGSCMKHSLVALQLHCSCMAILKHDLKTTHQLHPLTCVLLQNSLVMLAGDQLLQLYGHFKSKAGPVLMSPAAAKLTDIAQLSTQLQKWDTALTAAQDVAATDTQAAARLVNDIIGAVQRCGVNVSMVVAAMPLLHAADQSASVVQVIQDQTDLSCRMSCLRPCVCLFV